MNATVGNPPIPPCPEHCQSHEVRKNPAQKRWYGDCWLCNYHFYRAYRALEMNNEGAV
jgi:hypothetical protein